MKRIEVMTKRSKSKYFKYLREKHSNCFYCNEPLVYYPLKRHERTPHNYATIEHINSRLSFPEGRPDVWGKFRSLVVVCHQCNGDMARLEDLLLPIEEKWERSGRKPLHLIT